MAANAVVIKGRNFDLKIGSLDSSIVGSANSFTVTANRDMIEVGPTFNQGRSKQFIADMYGYTCSADGFVLKGEASTQRGYFDLLNTMVNTDLSVNWTGLPDVSTTKYLTGWGYLSSAPYKVSVGALTTYSLEIQGSGDIVINNLA